MGFKTKKASSSVEEVFEIPAGIAGMMERFEASGVELEAASSFAVLPKGKHTLKEAVMSSIFYEDKNGAPHAIGALLAFPVNGRGQFIKYEVDEEGKFTPEVVDTPVGVLVALKKKPLNTLKDVAQGTKLGELEINTTASVRVVNGNPQVRTSIISMDN